MVAVFKTDITIDHTPPIRSYQYNIGFDSTCGVYNHSGAKAAVMPDTTADHRAVRETQLVLPIQSADRCRDQVEVGKCQTCADEGIAADHTHLQTSILRDHAIFHDSGHEKGRTKRQESPVSHHGEH